MTQDQTLIDVVEANVHLERSSKDPDITYIAIHKDKIKKAISGLLNSPETVESVEKEIEGWLPNDGLAYPTEQMAKAAIAEIQKRLICGS